MPTLRLGYEARVAWQNSDTPSGYGESIGLTRTRFSWPAQAGWVTSDSPAAGLARKVGRAGTDPDIYPYGPGIFQYRTGLGGGGASGQDVIHQHNMFTLEALGTAKRTLEVDPPFFGTQGRLAFALAGLFKH